MATKKQVMNLVKKLNATYHEDYVCGFTAEIHLPKGKRFSGYNTTLCVSTKMDYETMGEFWDDVLMQLSHPVEDC